MSLDKAIAHGKEKRKPYRGSKAIDYTCRNHGSCQWCEENRKHKFRDKHPVERERGKSMENCKNCIWHTEDGCWSWDCDPVTREEARELVDNARRENANAD